MKANKAGPIIVCLIILSVIIGLSVGPARLSMARKRAKQYTKETGISVEYELSPQLDTKEEFLMEIYRIALWEKETREALNRAFDHTDEEYKKEKLLEKSGYENKEELITFAWNEEWRNLRAKLDFEINSSINDLFGEDDEKYGIKRGAVSKCYRKARFNKILDIMKYVNDDDGRSAYEIGRYGLSEDFSALPMDIAFGLSPDLMISSCEELMKSAMNSTDYSEVRDVVDTMEKFAARYDVTITDMDKAKAKRDRLEYANKPQIPKVGMSISEAKSTKLGAPTRTTKKTNYWSHKNHTYGTMYWDRGDRQIFRADYFDGYIDQVWDTREYSGKPPSYSSYNATPRKSKSIDPDDHDIEAYYDDHRDLYLDYEDAYDGFLDDEDAWDDY